MIQEPTKLKATKHNMKRRAQWHDYRHPGFYLLTLVVNNRYPILGNLVANPTPNIILSPLGTTIADKEIHKISQVYPFVKVRKLCIMPDHIHIILHIDGWFQEGKCLADVVRGFKSGCNKAWREMIMVSQQSREAQVHQGLFEKGYNDRLLFNEAQLIRWERYLDDNPRRLFIKKMNPNMFTIQSHINIFGYDCQLVGNRFLLDIPDKVAVIVHRRYSEQEYQSFTKSWLDCGERGGVLVSAAISQKEKLVMREAMNRGYKLILLRENGFSEYYKPSGESFDACACGQLLQLCPWEYHTEKRRITRTQCEILNHLAQNIANQTY